MQLKNIVSDLLIKEIINDENIEISNIQYDSRKVSNGSLFICLPGYTVDGHNFISQAVENGAVAILIERDVQLPQGITVVKVPDVRRAMAFISDKFYNYPTQTLQAIGVTGTNGKTTTTSIIQEILNDNNKQTGSIGTINIKYGETVIDSTNTTPDTLELQQIFNDMKNSNMSHVVMEVSSHALSLGRVRGTKFKTAVFTNLTQDHLDYHKTMEDYANAKGLLFSQLGNDYGNNQNYAVLNIDDEISKKYAEITPAQVITYGIDNKADVFAKDIKLTPQGTEFELETFKGNITIKTKLIGKFNVYNLLAAISTCLIENIELRQIASSIEKISGIDGRFESVYEGQEFTVIVDYAHTPDSLENVLKTAREFSKGKITCVVGCGGNRDTTKRPIMAHIAEKYSDFVILTSDNPRNEDPLNILNDMEKGITGEKEKDYIKLSDRKNAIEKAISLCSLSQSKDDCIVIVGKGHETYQIIGKETIHFDDREIAREFLKKTPNEKELETID